jgi:hypothetical protein
MVSMPEDPVPKHQQIAEVMREEKARGRCGPASIAARREWARLARLFRKHLERGTEEEFCAAIRALKPPLGAERFRAALQIWRANRRS